MFRKLLRAETQEAGIKELAAMKASSAVAPHITFIQKFALTTANSQLAPTVCSTPV